MYVLKLIVLVYYFGQLVCVHPLTLQCQMYTCTFWDPVTLYAYSVSILLLCKYTDFLTLHFQCHLNNV